MTKSITAAQKKEKFLEYAELKTLETAVKKRMDEIKPEVNEIMYRDFMDEGIEKRTARIGNNIVGTLTVVKDKCCYDVTDQDAFIEWLQEYDLGTVKRKVNVYASDEIYNMLAKHYSEDDIAHLFVSEPLPYKDTDSRILACEDVCLLEGMPAVIPGIKPKANPFKYVRVTDTNLNKCVSSLANQKGGMLALLTGSQE